MGGPGSFAALKMPLGGPLGAPPPAAPAAAAVAAAAEPVAAARDAPFVGEDEAGPTATEGACLENAECS